MVGATRATALASRAAAAGFERSPEPAAHAVSEAAAAKAAASKVMRPGSHASSHPCSSEGRTVEIAHDVAVTSRATLLESVPTVARMNPLAQIGDALILG